MTLNRSLWPVIIVLCTPSLVQCGRTKRAEHPPFVQTLDQRQAEENVPTSSGETLARTDESLGQNDARLASIGAAPASTAVTGELKLVKNAIFDRVFLYGFDLQYSSTADADWELIPQAMALGHVPSYFRRIGDRLQLVAEQSRLFESNINRPELLINEYEIVDEDDETLSVNFVHGGIVLNQVANGQKAEAPKQTWIRSIEFKADKNILLQETGLLLADGSVATFMESLLPRASLVPEGYQGLESNADNEALAARYRFLGGETVYVDRDENGETVRAQTAFASRFHIPEGGTIDWYITPNVPDRFLPAIKSGIEGWNRYFRVQMGRDVVRFVGKLPAGAKLGDPTLNVVNWDSVAEAGAAYESQAVDPLTGIQSHSLIYMPLAWYNIGIALWEGRVGPEQPDSGELMSRLSPKNPQLLLGNRPILRCMRSADDLALPMAALMKRIENGEPSLRTLDDFGMRLVAAVLFHEVGHALGLAHNFKASLSYDGEQPVSTQNPTTHSAMDYNYFQLEMDLFTAMDEIDGPSLEYDRQIISQLYNQGKDVGPSDPVLPACDDTEADATAGGVDPLCVRYDSGKSPIQGIQHAFHNLVATSGAKAFEPQTLTEAMTTLGVAIEAKLAAESGSASYLKSAEQFGQQLGALASYYLSSGAQSLRVNLRNSEKALRVWQSGSSADEQLLRSEYFQLLKEALSMRELPANPKAAVDRLAERVYAIALANESLGATEAERMAAAQSARTAVLNAIDKKSRESFSRIRQSIYGILGYDAANPFALKLSPDGALSGFEDFALSTLQSGVLDSLAAEPSIRSMLKDERNIAASQLKTFASVHEVVPGVRVKLKVLLEQALASGDQELVQETRELLRNLE